MYLNRVLSTEGVNTSRACAVPEEKIFWDLPRPAGKSECLLPTPITAGGLLWGGCPELVLQAIPVQVQILHNHHHFWAVQGKENAFGARAGVQLPLGLFSVSGLRPPHAVQSGLYMLQYYPVLPNPKHCCGTNRAMRGGV